MIHSTTCWLSRSRYRGREYRMIPSVMRWNTITLTNGAKGPPVDSGQPHQTAVRKATLWIPSLTSKAFLLRFQQIEADDGVRTNTTIPRHRRSISHPSHLHRVSTPHRPTPAKVVAHSLCQALVRLPQDGLHPIWTSRTMAKATRAQMIHSVTRKSLLLTRSPTRRLDLMLDPSRESWQSLRKTI